ncbi:hypothetical protein SAY87_013763 [Trapa incisa]|uniref:Ubiquitin-like domain-containing protein n=1 Tax=Trapa incisa TaxID=236973 RepID=A0AAN7KBR0_9MYRT|nr:hypothetical protein SAY87_013763 [Trapa incisa]
MIHFPYWKRKACSPLTMAGFSWGCVSNEDVIIFQLEISMYRRSLRLKLMLFVVKEMERSGVSEIPKFDEAEGSETTIEIKVKTLDSQTYTLRVDKQMPIPALKQQIATVTGVLSEQQRLICRGKVLKDDQLLSAYHVEDGHTLHLVVRQPVPLSGGVSPQTASDLSSGVNHSSGTHISPAIFIEAIRSPDQGDVVPPEIERIVSAVLGSFGITNLGSSTEGRSERYSAGDSFLNSTLQQSDYTGLRGPSNAFGLPTAISVGQPPVIPDSLMTMSHYISGMRGEFDNFGRGIGHISQSAGSASVEGGDPTNVSQTAVRDGLPTAASLAELVLSTRQLLTEQVGESLQLFVRQLENQANYSNPSMLSSTQNNAMRIGTLLHYLGAYILELGRTAMTLRLGQSPAESVVNAGPAIYISPLGPNPLMAQPLPLQMGTSIGNIPGGTVQSSPSFGAGISNGFLPRRIDIQIRRAAPNANGEGNGDRQQPMTAPRNIAVDSTASGNPVVQPSSGATEDQPQAFVRESGIRVVPVHTIVAALPATIGQMPSDSLTDSPSVRVQASISQTANNTPPADEPHDNQENGGQVPESVYQILRSLFPGGEIHVEEESTIDNGTISDHDELGTPGNPSPDPQETEAVPTMDGIFLSNLLHQIMPIISQHLASADSSSANDPNDQAGGSSGARTRHQPNDTDMDPPNSKRQKRE